MIARAGHPPQDSSADPAAGEWSQVTRRQIALCLRDPAARQACADSSDRLEAAGVEPLTAVRQALGERGG